MFFEKFKFKIKEEGAIGLDIGTSSIKAVALEVKDKEVFLKNFSFKEISDGSIGPANLAPLIKKSIDALGVSEGRVNISLSGQPVIIRYAWLPLMSQKELASSLRFEAAKLIPFSVEEVNIDSYILKQDISNNKMLVMVVAAKKEAVSERIKLVQDSGFKIKAIDVDSLALINAFNFNYHSEDEKDLPKVIALLNIGAAVSNLSILEAGVPVFSRDIYIAGNNFSKKIADSLSIDLKAAEDLKINPDKEKLEKVSAAIELILSSLASEVRTSFDYYESQSSSSVEKIFLSGGGSLFLNLKDSLNRLLGIGIDYWDPTKRITFLAGQDSSQQIKSYLRHFPVALGLAMR